MASGMDKRYHMKFHLIYPNMDSDTGNVQFGIASLSSVLKEDGHKVTLTHLKKGDRETYVDKTSREIRKHDPDVIGFSLTELEEQAFRRMTERIKTEFDIPIIAGGPYPTIAPDWIMEKYKVDILVQGEAENVLKELLESLERRRPIDGIMGAWSRNGRRLIKNKVAKPPDITELPPMDFSIFDEESVIRDEFEGEKKLGYLCNRGCPFKCSYCLNVHVRSLYPVDSKYVRYQKVDKIIEEIKILQDMYDFKSIGFYDDTFLLNTKWIEEFSGKYKEEIDMPFYCNARPETCKEEMVSKVAEAGCTRLEIGLESGNEKLREMVLKRKMSNSQITRAFKLAEKYEMKKYTFSMIGIPYETEKNINETIGLNARIKPDVLQASAFYPFRGTELGELCYEKDWVLRERKDEVKSYFEGSVLRFPQLRTEIIDWYTKNFLLLYYAKTSPRNFAREAIERLSKRFRVGDKIFKMREQVYKLRGGETA
jgi:radical SAM superfamily enzyme YgiQ (UPF0313 family)